MRRRTHLGIESLESRRLMAAISWTGWAGASDRTWSNPLNWSTNTVPNAYDDVTLGSSVPITVGNAAARTVVVTAPSVSISGGTLSVGLAFNVRNYAGFTTAYGSTLAGTGTLYVEAGGHFGPDAVGDTVLNGNVTLPKIYNYGSFNMTGGHDIGGTFYNYGRAQSIENANRLVEDGHYYTRFINEPTGALAGTYLPNSSGGPAIFGIARDAQGVVSAVPFVNMGFVYATELSKPAPGSGLSDTPWGQKMIFDLDATPTIGGTWQGSDGLIEFGSLSTTTPATSSTDSTFSLVDGELSTNNVQLTINSGIANGAGLSVTGALASVTLNQPRVSLGLLELLGGTLSLGSGGTAVRTDEVNFNSAAVFNLGDGTFIDGDQPYFSVNREFPSAGTPANEPTAYADLLRATIGGDTLVVGSGTGTSATKALGYARGDGLASAYPSGTFSGLPFDANDFVFRGTLRGDTDLDRDVDFNDLLTLARHYGQTTARGVADGNFDDPTNAAGTVDFTDLLSLARNYGQTLTVPAPVAAANRSPRTARVAATILE